jgi:curli production assembly/transport component CsgG
MESAVSKNILSTSISQDIFRFIEQGTELVEIEGGVAENEVGSIALQKAIESGVLNLIEIGIERGYWEYETIKIDEPCDANECIDIRG